VSDIERNKQTVVELYELAFTLKVLLRFGGQILRQDPSSQARGTFQLINTSPDTMITNNPG
jgi:hypothetical protein